MTRVAGSRGRRRRRGRAACAPRSRTTPRLGRALGAETTGSPARHSARAGTRRVAARRSCGPAPRASTTTSSCAAPSRRSRRRARARAARQRRAPRAARAAPPRSRWPGSRRTARAAAVVAGERPARRPRQPRRAASPARRADERASPRSRPPCAPTRRTRPRSTTSSSSCGAARPRRRARGRATDPGARRSGRRGAGVGHAGAGVLTVLGASLTFLTPSAALARSSALSACRSSRRGPTRPRRAAALGLPPAAVRRIVAVPRRGRSRSACCSGSPPRSPSLRTTRDRLARTESQVFFVVDVSRSMRPSDGAGSATRLDRARTRRATCAARARRPGGRRGLTDRVLPYVFPTLDGATFADTLRRSVTVESPPPQEVGTVATSFDALPASRRAASSPRTRSVARASSSPTARAAPFSAAGVGRALAGPRGCRLVIVHVGSARRARVRGDGRPGPSTGPDAAARATVDALAAVAGGRSSARTIGDAAAARALAAEAGPARRGTREERGRARAVPRGRRARARCSCS